MSATNRRRSGTTSQFGLYSHRYSIKSSVAFPHRPDRATLIGDGISGAVRYVTAMLELQVDVPLQASCRLVRDAMYLCGGDSFLLRCFDMYIDGKKNSEFIYTSAGHDIIGKVASNLRNYASKVMFCRVR